ncbi:4-coumarate--CoA ligase 1-like, partial [Asbolus verrucosus]
MCFETGKYYTFKEVYDRSRSLASILRKKFHLGLGDTVALVLPNVPDFPIAFLGAIQAGLVVTTVNPSYTADEMAVQFNDSGSKIVFTIVELLSLVNKATNSLKKKIPVVLAELKSGESVPQNCIKLDELCEGKAQSDYLCVINPEHVALLPYSSGTTGLSKGVQLSHKNVVSNLYQMSAPDFIVNLKTEGNYQDVIPVFLPLFHIYGMVGIFLNFFAQGCKLIMVPNFVASQFIKLLKLHQPTLLFAVLPIIVIILNNPKIKFEDLISVRTIVSAAAPLGVSAVEKFKYKIKEKISLLQMYGMTETSPLTLMQTTKLNNGAKTGGSGFLIPNTECKIISINDNSSDGLGTNEAGELLVRGPQIMKGYHNNPLATNEIILKDNWMRTGDVGHYDEHQHFFITDRLKELIKVKGFQVAPAELEELLKNHSSIEDAAVVGVPHPVQGEAPKAFVVLKNNCKIKPEQLNEYVASKVASYKRIIGGIVFTDKIPRNGAGKILRNQLRNS